jgi:hypothetical protein
MGLLGEDLYVFGDVDFALVTDLGDAGAGFERDDAVFLDFSADLGDAAAGFERDDAVFLDFAADLGDAAGGFGGDNVVFLDFATSLGDVAGGFGGDNVVFLDFAADLGDAVALPDLAPESASAFLHPLPTIQEHCGLAKHGCFLRIEHMI